MKIKKKILKLLFRSFSRFLIFETTFWLSSAIKAFVLVEIDTIHYLHIILDKMCKQVRDIKRRIFKKLGVYFSGSSRQREKVCTLLVPVFFSGCVLFGLPTVKLAQRIIFLQNLGFCVVPSFSLFFELGSRILFPELTILNLTNF